MSDQPLRRLRVAVRDLAEFVLQSGDLQVSFVGPQRALAGTLGHQRIQKSRPPEYQPEVAVSATLLFPGCALEIGGRIDGVWPTEAGIRLEEIKTTSLPLDAPSLTDHPVHWGQARLYACLLARRDDLPALEIQLTYLQIDTQEIREDRRRFTREDLETFFRQTVEAYLDWARRLFAWQTQRDASLAALGFPFAEYRKGQREMAVSVYRTVAAGGKLFLQAPTGLGKTMATVYPALKALGEGKAAKIFYLTAKTVGRQVAAAALRQLADRGMRAKVLTLTAKEKCCTLTEPECHPDVCPGARGFYDRLRPALEELQTHDVQNAATIAAVAAGHGICPFEFSLSASLWADVIIGDFNYAFDPRVFLRRFFDPVAEPYVFLVDEAHNLPDRAREMFSAELSKQTLWDVRKALREAAPNVAKALGGINSWFVAARKEALAQEGDPGGDRAGPAPGPESVQHRLESLLVQGLPAKDAAPGGTPPSGTPGGMPPRLPGGSVSEDSLDREIPSDGTRSGGPNETAAEDPLVVRTLPPSVSGALLGCETPAGKPKGTALGEPLVVRTLRASVPGAPSFVLLPDPPADLLKKLRRFLKVSEEWLRDHPSSPHRGTLLDAYFPALAFTRTAEEVDDHYAVYTEATGNDLRCRLFCVDPSSRLQEATKRARAAVFFSATLLPQEYFFTLCGGTEGEYFLRYPSPFPRRNLGLFLYSGVATDFRRRESSAADLAALIRRTVAARPGNYLVYFPSYAYLERVRTLLADGDPPWPIRVQRTGMSEEERAQFLEEFAADHPDGLVGLAVMGGIFGEGIDLVGDRLIGAIVVGVGLPQLCLERDLIRDQFARSHGQGFEFAYLYPGLNRVMQAAGRVIRTESDRGIVLLVDPRFAQDRYLRLFPREWSHARTLSSPTALQEALTRFWGAV